MNGLWSQFTGLFSQALRLVAGQFAFLGSLRWAVAIIVFTVAVRALMIPLSVKQIRATRNMQRLQPEIARLKQKYRNDRQRFAQEQMELMRREGVSPFASCLPTLAQFPVLWAMYFSIRGLNVGQMPFFGLGNLADPAKASVGGWILIVLMTVAQIWSMRQLSVFQEKSQQYLAYVMPAVFVVVMIRFPAGLVLYWAVSQIFQLGQQTIMLRKTPPPAPAAGKAGGSKSGDKDARLEPQPQSQGGGRGRNAPAKGSTHAVDRTRRPDRTGSQGRRRRGPRPA